MILDPISKIDQLKTLFAQKSKNQALYVITEQKSPATLQEASAISMVLTGTIPAEADNRLVLLKVSATF